MKLYDLFLSLSDGKSRKKKAHVEKLTIALTAFSREIVEICVDQIRESIGLVLPRWRNTMNLNYCPEQMTGRCVLLVCVSPLLIARLLESRCNDVSFAQKHTSDRYGVGLQTDCTLRETTAVLAPMSSGFEFDARRLTRSRVSVCTWSCLPAVRFDRGSDEVFSVGRRGGGRTGPPAGGSLCLVYARFMCTPHHSTSPHTVPAFCVLRQSAD